MRKLLALVMLMSRLLHAGRRSGVRFHDGRSLTARDVVWTMNSIRTGTVISPKATAYASVDSVEARDALTVSFV
jgi:peptide/nickel transport system substrate-binding protein